MFEVFFNHPWTAFRKGEFLFASGWSPWLLLLLAAVAAALIAWNLKRSATRLSRGKLAAIGALQAAMAALALFALWQPALAVRSLSSQQNVVSVLLDSSRSMALREDGESRMARAVEALQGGVLDRLGEKFRVRLYSFAGDVERLKSLEKPPAPGASTRIGEAVADVLRESAATPLGAIVVVSDGSDNSSSFDRELMAEVRSRNVPIHTVGVGREKIPNDLELADVSVAARSLPSSRVSAQAAIRNTGFTGKTRLTVRDGSRILASKDIELRPGEALQSEWIDFNAGEPGIRDLRFRLEPLPGEEIVGNNEQARVLDVPRGRKRILYAEGEPRWEYKFIRRAVHDDPSVQLVTLLRTSTNKFYRQGVDSPDELKDGFPTDANELFAYDALIIGSFEAAFFTPEQQELIRDFAGQRGGSLLLLGGRAGLGDGGWGASQAEEALPAALPETKSFVREKVPVQLTVYGRDSLICRLDADPEKNQKLWEEMPQLADYQLLGDLKPAAVTLLEVEVEGQRQPLLVSENYGRGKSLIFATGGSWRWKMSLPHDDERHHTFWRQLLRALTADSPPPVTLSSDRSLYADDSRIRLRAEVRTPEYKVANNAVVTAAVTTESGEAYTVELQPSPEEEGVYLAEIDADAPGAYRIEANAFVGDESLGSQALHVRRQNDVAEDFRPAQDRELLTRLAEQTGGRYWSVDNLAGLPEEIRFSESGITAREILDLWDMPVLFLALLLLKSTEWLLRRKWGVI